MACPESGLSVEEGPNQKNGGFVAWECKQCLRQLMLELRHRSNHKKKMRVDQGNPRSSRRGGGGETQSQGRRKSWTYKDAGVNIDAGSELVRRIAALIPGIGGFGGLFPLGDLYLVASTDGVGTKLKLAFELDVHDTIGIDLFRGTRYGELHVYLHEGCCRSSRVSLMDVVDQTVFCLEERQQMPGFYAKGEYDLSSFAVGTIKKDALIDGKNIMVGDQIIGLASSGVHSNGFSLVRRVLAKSGAALQDSLPGADGISIGEALLAPTVIYVKQVRELVAKGGVKGIAHITGYR